MNLNVAVFLGSKLGNDLKNIQTVKDFSEWFCSEKYNLIFGGTETGLMLELVKNVFKKNLQIISIFDKNLYDKYPNSKYFSELIITRDLSSKNELIIDKSDVFIALPGGVGTLNEILEVINKNLLNEIDKKIYLINDNFFWSPLEKFFKSLCEKQLVDQNKLIKNFKVCKLEELKSEFKKKYVKNRS
tara:strand:+ start:1425 stop:1985 length:561 start_codon:yes stop_codon:yes gene_type:complete